MHACEHAATANGGVDPAPQWCKAPSPVGIAAPCELPPSQSADLDEFGECSCGECSCGGGDTGGSGDAEADAGVEGATAPLPPCVLCSTGDCPPEQQPDGPPPPLPSESELVCPSFGCDNERVPAAHPWRRNMMRFTNVTPHREQRTRVWWRLGGGTGLSD